MDAGAQTAPLNIAQRYVKKAIFDYLCQMHGTNNRNMKKLFHFTAFAAAATAATALLATACSRSPQWRVAEGAIWHTTYRIAYLSDTGLEDSILQTMLTVEQSLSPFVPSSRISRINRNETDSTDCLIDHVFGISRHVSEISGGRFDPTVSPLVNLWGFGYDREARRQIEHDNDSSFRIPPAAIDSALTLVGIADCSINDGRIIKKHPSTTFNFSSVTKGFACDMVSAMLLRNAAGDHMVEIGGEIAISGHNPQNKEWRIQIDAPSGSSPAAHTPLRIISPPTGGIATSGNYRNFHDTARYGRVGHTIDPSTGMPVHSPVASATVTAPTCALADALATACMAASSQSQAMEIINAVPAAECLLVICHGDSLVTVTTPGFPQ